MLHELFVKAPDKRSETTIPPHSMCIERVKAAYNRITTARIFNPVTGKQKIVYCQRDPGSQLTFISSRLVDELDLKPSIGHRLNLTL